MRTGLGAGLGSEAWEAAGRDWWLRFQDSLAAARFRTGISDAVVLAVETDDEHGTAVHLAARLIGGKFGGVVAAGRDIAEALSEAAAAELVGAAEEVNGEVGAVRGDAGFHRAEMFVTQGEDVRPHA